MHHSRICSVLIAQHIQRLLLIEGVVIERVERHSLRISGARLDVAAYAKRILLVDSCCSRPNWARRTLLPATHIISSPFMIELPAGRKQDMFVLVTTANLTKQVLQYRKELVPYSGRDKFYGR